MGLGNCCFCIPLRVGVTTIAIVSSLFYIAILSWLLVDRNVIYTLPQETLSSASAIFWILIAMISLFAACSLFGVLGGLTQNKTMINIFRYLYWTVTILLLISSTAIWIFMMVKQNSLVTSCQDYLTLSTASSDSYYSAVTLPDGIASTLHKEDCVTAVRQWLIISGIIVFLGNFVQVYFASTISAYARRLKAGMTSQHQQLRDLDDFPEKMSVY
ncbi:uncharacterized protein B0P05DRAFT_565210 [Gilbertella persicaria]|uniref:uncharacterized protein n=1 Tax=Gilbertella persicaria TaxID=101096 RepID=UPI0022203CB3|nr:uncharacterized protein B0P05DRAFT_565210 [Gilbertella persicaria]KAI8047828.1 hypothetical protein B0P05DRAFT_565210 [Gilbertella persicaria]